MKELNCKICNKNIDDKTIYSKSNFCECEDIFHNECFENYYLINLSCPTCNKINHI
jgi:hypothetical protein